MATRAAAIGRLSGYQTNYQTVPPYWNQLPTSSRAHCQRKEDLKYNISKPADSVISLSLF